MKILSIEAHRESMGKCLWYRYSIALVGVELSMMIFCAGGFVVQLTIDWLRRYWVWDSRA